MTCPVSAIAGALAKNLRIHSCCQIAGSTSEEINRAVKAVALARSFLIPEGISLFCNSEEYGRDGDPADAGRLRITVNGVQGGRAPPDGLDVSQLSDEAGEDEAVDIVIRVRASSESRRTAGAIAKLARSQCFPEKRRQSAAVLAMGAAAVQCAAQAITTARDMLVHDAVDLRFRPRFIHIEDEDTHDPKPAVQISLLFIIKSPEYRVAQGGGAGPPPHGRYHSTAGSAMPGSHSHHPGDPRTGGGKGKGRQGKGKGNWRAGGGGTSGAAGHGGGAAAGSPPRHPPPHPPPQPQYVSVPGDPVSPGASMGSYQASQALPPAGQVQQGGDSAPATYAAEPTPGGAEAQAPGSASANWSSSSM